MSISKKLALTSSAIILAAVGTVAGLELSNTTHWFHNQPAVTFQPSVNKTNTNGKFGATSNTNNSSSNPPDNTSPHTNNQTPIQYGTPKNYSQPPANQITGVVNYAQVNEGNLVVRVTIDQTISQGTCVLALISQSNGATVTKTASVITNPTSSSCKGFSVPTAELSPGKWNIAVKITSGSKSGTLTHAPVTI